MSDVNSITVISRRAPSIVGDHDIRSVAFHREGLCVIEQSSSGEDDEFTNPPIAYSFEIGSDMFGRIRDSVKMILDDIAGTSLVRICRDDGTCDEIHLGSDSEVSALISAEFGGLLEFEESSLSTIRISNYSSGQLDDLLERGIISKDTFDANIERIAAAEKRKTDVKVSVENGTYPFDATPAEIIDDMKDGLLTDEQYNMFAWFCRIRKVCGTSDRSEEFISMKLRFSVWGQRLLGKYDTYEYLLDREESAVVDRRYSVHGTLFEGCGNYKAPDDAERIPLPAERTHLVFRYLGMLIDCGILGKDHSETQYDCAFFDLYTRFTDRPSLHTKGTSDYPIFIRMLMYLMEQDLSSIY